jgi:hypothetical protein
MKAVQLQFEKTFQSNPIMSYLHPCMKCGYEVPRMILLLELKEAMQLDHSKDISMHV